MAFHETPFYEFNRFAPWELFCSTYRVCHEAEEAKSAIERLHHNRSVLLFTFSGIEASLNYVVQRLATTSNEDRTKFIRQKKLDDKLDYVENKTQQTIERTEFDILANEYEFLRHEIVHHKRTDQQPQFHVQHLQPRKVLRLLQTFLVRVFIASHVEFPYWLTGWNYVGFGGNMHELLLSNNGNGFGHSLGSMGFQFKLHCGPGSMAFPDAHMATIDGFDEILAFLNAYPSDAEPFSQYFPSRPRLVRRWWCREVIEFVAKCESQ